MSSVPAQADPALVALFNDVLGDYRPQADSATGAFDRDLWDLLVNLGLTRLTGDEDDGGSGATWYDAAALHEVAARYGVQIPLVEHDLLATWLLSTLGMPVPGGIATIGWVEAGATSTSVPWAAVADEIVLVHSDPTGRQRVRVVAPADITISPGENIAGLPRDTVSEMPSTGWAEVNPNTVVSLRNRAALARAIQVCGAMDAALEMTVRHTSERSQFGRPLANFQAVQHRLAAAAAEAALARAATRAALDEAVATDFLGVDVDTAIAVARSLAGHAGSAVVRSAHQLHGAMGTTMEHPLRLVTVPILGWLNEHGTVAEFDAQLTRAVLASEASTAGAESPRGLWSLVSDQRPPSAPTGP